MLAPHIQDSLLKDRRSSFGVSPFDGHIFRIGIRRSAFSILK
jgi:hypothetical protein